MPRPGLLAAAIAALLAALPIPALGGGGVDSLRLRIEQLIADSVFSRSSIGVEIVALDDSALLYAHGERKLFHPASNAKLFTTAAALALLPRTYEFTTRLLAGGRVAGKSIEGPLIVEGRGDPLMAAADLGLLAKRLAAHGIGGVSGGIVGSVGWFDDLAWGRGWMWDDEPDPDEAFLSPLTVDGNCMTVTVRAGRRNGDPLRVSVSPRPPGITIANRGRTAAGGETLKVTRRHGMILVTGTMPRLAPAREELMSVPDPPALYLELLRSRLREAGIAVAGKTRVSSLGARGEPLAELRHPLDSVVFRINKKSDNVAAENLLKTIGAELDGPPGSAERGIAAVRGFCSRIGIDTSALLLADGSGVSFYSLVTPDAIVRVLRHMHGERGNNPAWRAWYESLPIAGVDGTLQGRMRNTAAEGNVRGKTGSLTGSSALSGYVTTRDGSLVAFSILADHFAQPIAPLRALQDSILAAVALTRLR